MDSELVSGSQSEGYARDGGVSRPSRVLTYAEQFEELCPYYLAMGRTYNEYWNGDCEMVKAFRKAKRLRNEEENYRLWLQGVYVYEALCCVVPALQAFNPKQPRPYPSKPHGTETSPAAAGETPVSEEEKQMKRNKTFMEIFAVNFNQHLNKEGGVSNA